MSKQKITVNNGEMTTKDKRGRMTAKSRNSAEFRIRLNFTPGGVRDELLKDCRAVVIDVLRAATSIVTALNNGAQYVIPASSVAAASNLASQLPRDDVLLCGERDVKLIDGFNLSNSPSEYSREKVKGRKLIFASTNGAPAIVKSSAAKSVYMCGYVNLNAVIDALLKEDASSPIIIVCSGDYNSFSLEDAVCGGTLIKRLCEKANIEPNLNDGANAALILADKFGDDILKLLNESDHGKYLKELGMGEDLVQCAYDSVYSIVPMLNDGRLVKLGK
ncbi:MAG: 2-phosphosulfolactate phosphatase [Candidatus Hatepunaea meridiana]|nr:2-phosphosulfolactate phosphatase [Candidatus Hatepunaea meridiana]